MLQRRSSSIWSSLMTLMTLMNRMTRMTRMTLMTRIPPAATVNSSDICYAIQDKLVRSRDQPQALGTLIPRSTKVFCIFASSRSYITQNTHSYNTLNTHTHNRHTKTPHTQHTPHTMHAHSHKRRYYTGRRSIRADQRVVPRLCRLQGAECDSSLA